jgi:hypothetical protein
LKPPVDAAVVELSQQQLSFTLLDVQDEKLSAEHSTASERAAKWEEGNMHSAMILVKTCICRGVNRCRHMHLPHAASSPDGVKRDKNSTSDAANATRVLAAAPIWAIVVPTNAAGARRIPRELACIGHCLCQYLLRLRQRVVNMRVVVNIIQLQRS